MTPIQLKAIGRFIRRRRDEAGLTIRQLEELSGVPNSTITRLEWGQRRRIDVDVLGRLGGALGLGLNEMVAPGQAEQALPSLQVYLRRRYGELPDEAIEQMERYFAFVAHEYGIDPQDLIG